MKVKEIMTRSLVRTKMGYTIKEVSRFLLKHHLNSMPVVDNENRLVGIITRADIFRALLPGQNDRYQSFEQMEKYTNKRAEQKVEEVMSKPVITVNVDTPIIKAGSILLLERIKQLPVVKNEKPVGMLSLTDLIEALLVSSPKK